MTHRRTTPVALLLLALTLACEVVSVVWSWRLEPVFDTVAYALVTVLTAAAGSLVAARHPRNPVGWLLVGFSLLNGVSDAAQGWGLRGAVEGWSHVPLAEIVTTSTWLPSSLGLTLTFLLFPDGRMPHRRWRWVAYASAIGVLLAVPGWSLSPTRREEFTAGTNPFAVESLPTAAMFAVGVVLVVVSLVASCVALGLRLRRAAGAERQQLKWVAYGAVVTVTLLPLSAALWYVSPVSRVLPVIALTTVPVAACVAILRYRLYDIDLLIDRTVVYVALTAALAASFLAVTLVIGTALGGDSGWATAAATLTVAVAFQPVRTRLQRWVDRHFHRARFDARTRMSEFLEDLRAGRRQPEEVQQVLRELLDDPELDLLVHLPQSHVLVDVAGTTRSPAEATRAQVELHRAGAPLGVVLHDPDTVHEPGLLTDVVESAGLAIEILRLHVEVRRQLAEVEASRARIVSAGMAERRRIERDLHDGAQQRLVSIGLALRHAQHELRTSSSASVAEALDGAVAEVSTTIAELRELAHGLPPSQLDAGLAPAFLDLARRSPLPVRVRASRERFGQDLEGAAWFIGCEGVTNAVKHAGASSITLSAARRAHTLVVTVTDDGVGGARPRGGSGLAGLADRVSALGGVLTLTSPAGSGTTLTAELPCGS